jgi:hypothetical protein
MRRSPSTEEFIRVKEGGEVTDRITLPKGKGAYACMLGGEDRKTLFLCTSEGTEQDRVAGRSRGWIETVGRGSRPARRCPAAPWPADQVQFRAARDGSSWPISTRIGVSPQWPPRESSCAAL